jgi:hypothetical protein
MRKYLLLLLALPLTACKPVTVLPPWAPNVQIATVGSVISSAVSVVNGYEQDQKDCATNPSLTKCPGVSNAVIHSSVQRIQQALTVAQPEFQQWEADLKTNAASVEPADLTTQISTIQTNLAQLPTSAK